MKLSALGVYGDAHNLEPISAKKISRYCPLKNIHNINLARISMRI
jgi:hypothetical protein